MENRSVWPILISARQKVFDGLLDSEILPRAFTMLKSDVINATG